MTTPAPAKTVAIIQSSYVPWKGYFDIIRRCDQFILYDEVQFTRRDWRNRNRIKTAQGLHWLTIPMMNKGNYHCPIAEMMVSDDGWADRHWQVIRQSYCRASGFEMVAGAIEKMYADCPKGYLSEINRFFLESVMGLLKIETPLSWSSGYRAQSTDPTERLVEICQAAGASRYLSGPSAKAYLKNDLFDEAGIDLEFMEYSDYPPYPQLFGAFEHYVSILDLLLNTGSKATDFIRAGSLQTPVT